MIIDLSPSMQERVTEWKRMGHNIDPILIHECGYYPRGGCQYCLFDSPNPNCRWGHILIDTRINPSIPSSSKHQNKTGRKVIKVEVLLSRLPEEVREEIRKIVNEGR